jgi:hypothetical protein
MYRIDSLHPDRLVCEACALTVGPVTLDLGQVPLAAFPAADASAEWPEVASAIRAHEARCQGQKVGTHLLNGHAGQG